MGTKAEVLEKFALGFKRLDEAVAAVEDFLGMQTCDGTGRSVWTDGWMAFLCRGNVCLY